MTEKTETRVAEATETLVAQAEPEFDAEAGIGAAAFASAESREILNLLADGASGGSCCGGSCGCGA